MLFPACALSFWAWNISVLLLDYARYRNDKATHEGGADTEESNEDTDSNGD